MRAKVKIGSGTRVKLLALMALCGGAVSLPACKSAPQRPVKAQSNAIPVNTALANIADDPGLALPRDEELMKREHDASVYEQIEESARQLNVYFANLEIDGPGPVRVPPRVNVPVQSTTSIQTDKATNNQTDNQTAKQADNRATPGGQPGGGAETGGVRVSLLGGSSDQGHEASVAVDSPVPGDETGGADPGGAGFRAATRGEPIDAEPTDDPPAPTVDPLVRKQQLARELASILSDLASTSDDPGSAALALASLETLLPDDSETPLDQGVLSEAERASLDAARAFLRSMSAGGSIANPSEVASELEQIQIQLNTWAGMTIRKAALCTRVDGYGRYETFPSYRFVAGRAQPAIVYVELERFNQREFPGPDGSPRFETRLSQKLELYHVADDLNTWNTATESVSDETRNRLRDYYLINQINIPPNLGVGRYHLKVVMRDLVGDRTAEAIIPIEIVAHD